MKEKRLPVKLASIMERALKFHHEGRLEAAANEYRAAIQMDYRNAVAWSNLGTVLRKLGHTQAALACASGLLLEPGQSGLSDQSRQRADRSRPQGRSARGPCQGYEARPDDFLIRKNYANCLREFGHFEQALTHYEAACAMQPEHKRREVGPDDDPALSGPVQRGLGEFLYEMGNAGSKNEADRGNAVAGPGPQRQDDPRPRRARLWRHGALRPLSADGEDPRRARDFECKKPLHKLFSTIPGIDRIAEYGEVDEPFEYQVPIMSLPVVFRTDLNSIPPVPELLVPDHAACPREKAARRRG